MKQTSTNLTLVILAISTSLLGLSMGLIGHHKHITLITDFYSITQLLPNNVYNIAASLGFVASAVLSLASIKYARLLPLLGYLLIVISVIPLASLLGGSMWIDSLGGFPAIGAGQGVIKYAALMSIGLLFVLPNLSIITKKWLCIAPVLLVLVWIGGMKFTLLEAKGIEDLVRSSPLMAWMYNLWDLQKTSNIIGVYDLIAVAILIGSVFNPRLLIPAIAMSGAVFVVTQSFLITWDGAISATTLLSTGGHFLIKDLWFIANLILLWQVAQQAKLAHSDTLIYITE
ncbi:DUF417 family protein [Psychrobium sp. 1_MG-2023]|uniref:DUF417 family protein n=1 Tax=Psychrobium sp. 1_MG-2023 TaxID=3062624 RepID=UPI000C347629|nr:DUF417 family protein [Psychrobium sp. 1_MG-2023]MDP2561379.1 DUF417 family protein [Psychrobium sp. 1_MG-2023]PKF54859.1 hypothetical protein CW748_15030 [Alteromonadales bacterium alter-6D02]